MCEKRLFTLFDGTWNDPEDNTNVFRTYNVINQCITRNREIFYDPGVGTSASERLRGGIFGYGLSENLIQGYRFICKHYDEQAEIWIFGFSRGAYTARSLAGLIRKCGVLRHKNISENLLNECEDIYRKTDLEPDSERCKEFRKQYSHSDQQRIHFLGIWDTVGSLGIPGTLISERGKYAWHDTELSGTVDYAYHAMALDEHREIYNVPLWTSASGNKKDSNKDVEQRWFIGAHANVGGGYGADDPLPDLSFQWMIEKAYAAGLGLEAPAMRQDAWARQPTDSFSDFLNGKYKFWREIKRYFTGKQARFYRKFDKGIYQCVDGRFEYRPAVNVTVDPSVWTRWQHGSPEYRPPTLQKAGWPPPTFLGQ